MPCTLIKNGQGRAGLGIGIDVWVGRIKGFDALGCATTLKTIGCGNARGHKSHDTSFQSIWYQINICITRCNKNQTRAKVV